MVRVTPRDDSRELLLEGALALPDEPDVERVDAWLVSAHLRHWELRGD